MAEVNYQDVLGAMLRSVDFKGVSFKDISTLLRDPEGLRLSIEGLCKKIRALDVKVDYIAGMEARGFIFGTAVAYELGVGFVMLRKPHKLPGELYSIEYGTEYSKDSLNIGKDLLPAGSSVVVVDDLLATGGTARAACQLLTMAGCTDEQQLLNYNLAVPAAGFVVDLKFLPGSSLLEKDGLKVISLVDYHE